jgi:hypothetical protein
VGIDRSLAGLLLVLVPCWGCGMGPRTFRKIQHPAPLVRARAIGLGDDQPNSRVVPALVGRLEDPDPVVRLAASEELRRRTGRDFGFIPWASQEERSRSIRRWRAWLLGRSLPEDSGRSPTTGRPPRSGSGTTPPAAPARSGRPLVP